MTLLLLKSKKSNPNLSRRPNRSLMNLLRRMFRTRSSSWHRLRRMRANRNKTTPSLPSNLKPWRPRLVKKCEPKYNRMKTLEMNSKLRSMIKKRRLLPKRKNLKAKSEFWKQPANKAWLKLMPNRMHSKNKSQPLKPNWNGAKRCNRSSNLSSNRESNQ